MSIEIGANIVKHRLHVCLVFWCAVRGVSGRGLAVVVALVAHRPPVAVGQVVEVAAVEDEVEHLGVAVSVVRAHDVLGRVRPPDAVPVLAAVVLVREVAGTCRTMMRSMQHIAALGAGNDVWSTVAQYCCPLQAAGDLSPRS